LNELLRENKTRTLLSFSQFGTNPPIIATSFQRLVQNAGVYRSPDGECRGALINGDAGMQVNSGAMTM